MRLDQLLAGHKQTGHGANLSRRSLSNPAKTALLPGDFCLLELKKQSCE